MATSNKILEMIQKKHPEYHPLMSLADLALERSEEGTMVASIGQQIDCHKTIAKYVESELKSVEVTGNVRADFGQLRVVLESPGDIPTTFNENEEGGDQVSEVSTTDGQGNVQTGEAQTEAASESPTEESDSHTEAVSESPQTGADLGISTKLKQ